MRCLSSAFFVVLLPLVVLDKVVDFAAAADDSGWWPSELCPSWLQVDLSDKVSAGLS